MSGMGGKERGRGNGFDLERRGDDEANGRNTEERRGGMVEDITAAYTHTDRPRFPQCLGISSHFPIFEGDKQRNKSVAQTLRESGSVCVCMLP